MMLRLLAACRLPPTEQPPPACRQLSALYPGSLSFVLAHPALLLPLPCAAEEEFREAFAAVRLRCHRLVDFVRERRAVLQKLVLTNSEGYWAGARMGGKLRTLQPSPSSLACQ